MLKAIRVSVMLLALVGSAQAGEILTPPAPQPAQTDAAQETSTGGDMPNGYMPNGYMPNDLTNSLTEIAFDLLAVLPSLL